MKHFRIVEIHDHDAYATAPQLIGAIVTMNEAPPTADLTGGAYDKPSSIAGPAWRACSVIGASGREMFFAAVKLEEVLPS